MYLVLAALVGGAWVMYSNTGGEMTVKQELIEKLREAGDPDEKVAGLEGEVQALEGGGEVGTWPQGRSADFRPSWEQPSTRPNPGKLSTNGHTRNTPDTQHTKYESKPANMTVHGHVRAPILTTGAGRIHKRKNGQTLVEVEGRSHQSRVKIDRRHHNSTEGNNGRRLLASCPRRPHCLSQNGDMLLVAKHADHTKNVEWQSVHKIEIPSINYFYVRWV